MYVQFCDLESIPERIRFPAPEELLCVFAALNLGTISGSTASNRIAGLRAYHHTQNLPWFGGERLRLVLKGVSNLAPLSSRRPQRPPVEPSMLLSLREQLDTTSSFDSAVWSVATVAFWGQCRLGELLPRSRAGFSLYPFPRLSNISLSDPSSTSPTSIFLPHTKVSGLRGETIFLTRQEESVDASNALRHHIHLLHLQPSAPSIFVFIDPTSGELRPLTVSAFLKRCNQIWLSSHTTRITGHSFRIGGTSAYLGAGMSPDVVMKMGRWKSHSFLRYWRKTDKIIERNTKKIRMKSGPRRVILTVREPSGFHP